MTSISLGMVACGVACEADLMVTDLVFTPSA